MPPSISQRYKVRRGSEILLRKEFERPGSPGTTFSAPLRYKQKIAAWIGGSNLVGRRHWNEYSRRRQFSQLYSCFVDLLKESLVFARSNTRATSWRNKTLKYCSPTIYWVLDSNAHTFLPSELRTLLEWAPSLYSHGGAPPTPYYLTPMQLPFVMPIFLILWSYPVSPWTPKLIPSQNLTILSSSVLITLVSMLALCHHVAFAPGDALHLPPGTCHSCTCTNLTQTSATRTAQHHCTGFSTELPWCSDIIVPIPLKNLMRAEERVAMISSPFVTLPNCQSWERDTS